MNHVAIWETAFHVVGTEMGASLAYLRCQGVNQERGVRKEVGELTPAGRVDHAGPVKHHKTFMFTWSKMETFLKRLLYS